MVRVGDTIKVYEVMKVIDKLNAELLITKSHSIRRTDVD